MVALRAYHAVNVILVKAIFRDIANGVIRPVIECPLKVASAQLHRIFYPLGIL